MLTNNSLARQRIEKFLAIGFWVLVWQVASMVVGQEILLASPLAAVRKLIELMGTAGFYRAVFNSFARILLGFLLALALGCVLAVAAHAKHWVAVILHPPMAVISATPIASFVILALVFIGSKNLSVFISFLMVLPVIYLNVARGLESADPKLIEMADVFRVGRRKRVGYIYVPATLPYLLAACQVALGMCWKSGIAAEVIGQPARSIGEALYQAKIFYANDEIFAWTIAIIAVSVGFERLVVVLIGRITRRMEVGR